jgi:DNA-damage-inducible protein J
MKVTIYEMSNRIIREGIQMVQVNARVDEKIKNAAAQALDNYGLTISDAVRMLLTKIAKTGNLPVELTTDQAAYDAWFRAKVQEALDRRTPGREHKEVMRDMRALISVKKQNGRA